MTTIVPAPFPGIVTKVVVAIDQIVHAGEPICIIELMKMEQPIVASVTGRVVELRVTEGQPIGEGDTIAVLSE